MPIQNLSLKKKHLHERPFIIYLASFPMPNLNFYPPYYPHDVEWSWKSRQVRSENFKTSLRGIFLLLMNIL